MSLFVNGGNGKFDTTSDPSGNPPSDWGLTKASDAEVRYTTDNPIEGIGSALVNSRTIFNDDYALAFTNQGEVEQSGQGYSDDTTTDFNQNSNFTIELRHYLTEFTNRPDLFTLLLDNNEFLRITTNSDGQFFVQWSAPTISNPVRRVTLFDGDANLSKWKHVVLAFEQGVGVRFYVNGIKQENTIDAYIGEGTENILDVYYYLGLTSGRNPVGFGRGVRFFQGYAANDTDASDLYNSNPKTIQSVPVSMSSFLIREFLLNQEQGRTVNDSSNQDKDSSLNPFTTQVPSGGGGYTNQSVSFGGGAWVDVSGIN